MASDIAADPATIPSEERSWFARGVASVLVAFVASRVVIFALIAVSQMIVLSGRFGHAPGLLPALTDWDSAWYIGIAENGYSFTPGQQSNMGFFPLYPMLIWLFGQVLPSYGVAGIVVSHLCLLAAGLLLNALINLDYKDAGLNHAAAMFFMFNAVSFFYSDAYSESTFMMLALAAFLAARKDQWLLAALAGMCLAATRQVGFLIVVPLFVEFVQRHWDAKTGVRSLMNPRLLLLGLVPMGFAAFLFYGYLKFGDPMTYMKATAVWGRMFTSPLNTFASLNNYEPFYRILFAGSLVIAACLFATGIYLKIRASYLAYAAVLLGIYICSNSLEAIPRNLSVIFPFYLVLALVARRYSWSYTPMFAASVALLALCTILSANGYWMT